MTRALVVDDNTGNLYLLRVLLEGQGFDVDEARHGAEALAKARQIPPDIVVSDLLMPVMDGYTLLRHWKGDGRLRSIPFVVYTATYTEPKDERLAMDLGADAFILKPTEPGPLLARLQSVLAKARENTAEPTRRPTRDLESALSEHGEILIRKLEEKTEGQRRAEGALRNEQTLYQILAGSIPDHIYFKDRQSRFVRINRALMEALRLNDPSEAVGKTDFDFFTARHAERAYAHEQRIMQTGESLLDIEEEETWPDGRITWVRTTKVPFRDADGSIIGLVGVSRDVTERKKLEQQFLRAQRLESIGMLATGIAHDFNNVLAPVAMAASILREQVTDPEKLRLLDTLESCSKRGAALVQQILGFARGVGGEPRLVQVRHLIHDVAEVASETLPKSIRVVEDAPGNLWPVTGNPTQIHQVLLNLCVNARDAMPQGGTLLLRAENRRLDAEAANRMQGARPGAWVVLHVEDTGTGIAPEVLPRIWEPFFTTKGAEKGTGLGLSTVRGIVENHGGFIAMRTEPGRGTTFRIHLPASESAAAGDAGSAPRAAGRGKGELILLADNEPLIRQTVSAILGNAGYQVVTADDGLAAVSLFTPRAAEFSLVITDLDMPNLDGPALARAVHGLRPGMKILAMSGLHDRDAASGPELFAAAFLPKPFTATMLLSTVEGILKGASAGN